MESDHRIYTPSNELVKLAIKDSAFSEEKKLEVTAEDEEGIKICLRDMIHGALSSFVHRKLVTHPDASSREFLFCHYSGELKPEIREFLLDGMPPLKHPKEFSKALGGDLVRYMEQQGDIDHPIYTLSLNVLGVFYQPGIRAKTPVRATGSGAKLTRNITTS
ncbi:hypothetical protein HOA55_01045 [archaeon]|jgi:hypothetical protein|nr:hypothetical protein [archaeon]MBT3577546.1 hypothetical protein [archaeon]MBT6819921.1 hypothetical protein [archaeon]MBT6956669.1 hypothetical protein [archaeon]MBT7025077.1 hypothetical protein [archaeon]